MNDQQGMLHNMGGIVAALILGGLFLPVFITPNVNTGIWLLVPWWILLITGFVFWRRRRRLPPRLNTRHIPQDVKIAVSVRDGGKCVWCGTNKNIQFGHIIPFSNGGTATVDNLQLECQSCNLSKGNKYETPIIRRLSRTSS